MLMILAVFSIFFGFITKDMFIGLGSGFFSDNALFIHPSHEIMLDTEFGVPTLFKLLPLIFTISLSVIAIVLSEYLSTTLIYFKLSRVGYNIFSFFNQRFLIELFYNRYITGIVLKLGGQTTKIIDKGSVEYLGPYGLEKGLLNISYNISKLNTGVITTYALYVLIGLIFYLLCNSYLNNAIVIVAILISLSLLLNNRKTSTIYSLDTSTGHASLLKSSMNYKFISRLSLQKSLINSNFRFVLQWFKNYLRILEDKLAEILVLILYIWPPVIRKKTTECSAVMIGLLTVLNTLEENIPSANEVKNSVKDPTARIEVIKEQKKLVNTLGDAVSNQADRELANPTFFFLI